jgi:hypothetical protein
MNGLSVSNLVRVTVSLTPTGAQVLSFGILMVAGDSPVINGTERVRSYTSYSAVTDDFGVDAPESEAAQLYFGQSPQPAQMMIGRWIREATPGENIGGILTDDEQDITFWQSISNGAFTISVDGVSYNVEALDFAAVTNLNGVATIIQAALISEGATGATVTWNGSYFVVASGTDGAGVAASGTIAFSGAGTALDTVTINGKLITFVGSSPAANQVLIGGSATATAQNLMAFLLASVDPLLTVLSFSRVTTTITVTSNTIGTAGNSITLAKSSTAITLSASTLLGGLAPSSVGYATAGVSGTDIASTLQLTSALSQSLIPGYDAETPEECAQALCDASPLWYGLMFQASVQPTDDQAMDVAGLIEAQTIRRVYGVTITSTSVLSALVTNDLASRLQASNFLRTCSQYSQNAYAIASFFGRNFSVNYAGSNTTITVMYKQEPSVEAENLTEAQANTLRDKNCNVFVNYVNDTSIVQFGVMADGTFFDIVHDRDWFENATQTAVYNVLYTTTTKIPQTDAGMNQITNAIADVCQQAVDNGMVAPGTWNGPAFGSLLTGQFLKTGYYIYAPPIALQSQAARAARQAPVIQVALKLAGAIQTVDILVSVNQ